MTTIMHDMKTNKTYSGVDLDAILKDKYGSKKINVFVSKDEGGVKSATLYDLKTGDQLTEVKISEE